jgi:hypothetical protein
VRSSRDTSLGDVRGFRGRGAGGSPSRSTPGGPGADTGLAKRTGARGLAPRRRPQLSQRRAPPASHRLASALPAAPGQPQLPPAPLARRGDGHSPSAWCRGGPSRARAQGGQDRQGGRGAPPTRSSALPPPAHACAAAADSGRGRGRGRARAAAAVAAAAAARDPIPPVPRGSPGAGPVLFRDFPPVPESPRPQRWAGKLPLKVGAKYEEREGLGGQRRWEFTPPARTLVSYMINVSSYSLDSAIVPGRPKPVGEKGGVRV